MIGSRLAHYRIVDKLGAGGMGEVYLAEDTRLDRQVALKVLPAELADDKDRLQRFEREAKALAALDHPNIVTVFSVESAPVRGDRPEGDAGESAAPVHFLTMQRVRGKSLDRLISGEGMPLESVVRIGIQLADAVAAAHAQGIVHRDLKPGNVMVSDEGRVRVLDFGLAKSRPLPVGGEASQLATQTLTQEGVVVGTVPYMAPEQVQGREADARSDLFALGIMLYEMTTGARPFAGETPIDRMWSVVKDDPKPVTQRRPEAPERLAQLIERCLEKQPEERCQSATDLRSELQTIERELSEAAKTARSRPARPRSSSLRRRIGWSVAAVVVFLGSIFWASRLGREEPVPARSAEQPSVAEQGEDRTAVPDLVPGRILVVPFANRTGDPSLDSLGMMAADWITQGLAQAGIGQVVSSMTALSSWRGLSAMTGGPPEPNDLAVDTGAGTLIFGAYYQQGDGLVFSAESMDASAGETIGVVEPVQAKREEALQAVDTLRQALMVLVASHLDTRMQSFGPPLKLPSFEGYRLYTQGMEEFIRMDFRAAVDHFERAAGLDPTWVMPLLTAAMAQINLGDFAAAESLAKRAESERQSLSDLDEIFLDRILATCAEQPLAALGFARQGAELSPQGPFAFDAAAMAVRLNYAQEAVDRFEALDPERGFLRGFAPYWHYLTLSYHVLGEHESEVVAARRSRDLFPEWLEPLWFEMRALIGAGRVEEIGELLDAAESRRGTRTTPGLITVEAAAELTAHGWPEAGEQVARRAMRWFENRPAQEMQQAGNRSAYGVALLQAGEFEAARSVFSLLSEENPDRLQFRGYLGIIAARLTDDETAAAIVSWLDQIDRPYLFGAQIFWQSAIHAWSDELGEATRLYREALAAGMAFGWPRVHPHADPVLRPLWKHEPFQELIDPR